MKISPNTCPHCGAQLGEETRFCLYCMTSLTEKENIPLTVQRKPSHAVLWVVISVSLVLLLGATMAILLHIHDNNRNDTASHAVRLSTTTTVGMTTTATRSSVAPVDETIVWHYKRAGSSDYQYQYNDIEIENAIIITGFDRISNSGTYRIPATIDGKTVVAIDMRIGDGYTFSHPAVCENVTAIYLPAALNTITGKPFEACTNLSDLYIEGDYIFMTPDALAPEEERTATLTLHSSEECWCLGGSKLLSVYCSFGWNEYHCEWEEWP